MVDRAFLEWDKLNMLKNLQQGVTHIQTTGNKTGVTAPLPADNTLLLELALIIIPTISGVSLIA